MSGVDYSRFAHIGESSSDEEEEEDEEEDEDEEEEIEERQNVFGNGPPGAGSMRAGPMSAGPMPAFVKMAPGHSPSTLRPVFWGHPRDFHAVIDPKRGFAHTWGVQVRAITCL